MAVTIWGVLSTYGDLKDFGAKEARISIAVVRNSGSFDVKFKFSSDGLTWPADADAVQVGTLPVSKPLEMIILNRGEIEIFDGASVLFRSKKAGIAGSWTTG